MEQATEEVGGKTQVKRHKLRKKDKGDKGEPVKSKENTHAIKVKKGNGARHIAQVKIELFSVGVL